MNGHVRLGLPIDVSVVVNLHNEGLLLHRTVTSVARAVDYAEAHGCSTEVVLVGDRLTATTREFLATSEFVQGASSVQEVNFGDLAASRNHGVSVSRGTFVAFCDGDDLLAEEWPYRAWAMAAKTDSSDVVAFHPRYIVTFDAQSYVVRYLSSTDPKFSVGGLAGENGWGPVVLVRREVLINHPFLSASSDGFGFEDWHWFAELLASGGRVECPPETVGFMRRKWEGSMLVNMVATHCLLRPTDLLRPSTLGAIQGHRPGEAVTQQRATIERSRGLREAIEQEGRRVVLRHPALVPYAHSARVLLRRIEQGLLGEQSRESKGLPSWLLATCLQMHELDYAIFPDDSLLKDGGPWFAGEGTNFGTAFETLCRTANYEVTHVLLAPWLKRGGADAEVINYAAALDSLGYGASTVVLATEDSPSPWSSRLPDSVRFVDLGSIVRELDFDNATRLLATYLVQAGPQVVHNFNSRLGYAAFQRYGKALTSASRLYACVFCEDLTTQGRTVGYVFEEVPRVAEYLTSITADNVGILRRLHQVYGIPKDKLVDHRHPVAVQVRPARSTPSDGNGDLRVLWAGRLDRQKRPDLLVAVAERCRGLAMRFHAYGAPVIASSNEVSLRPHGNVTFHGHYEDPSVMRWSDYDVFLNTSQWDGLPNVILEALAAGLPVVTSDVGGIAVAIDCAEAGILVSPFDHIEGYVDALTSLAADRTKRLEMGARGQSYIARYHSRDQFVAAVRAVPGYVSLPSSSAGSATPDATVVV